LSKGETEAIQDQTLQPKYHTIKILQTETAANCRLCKQSDETAKCIVSASQILAKEQYTEINETVCAQLHFNICKEIGVKADNEDCYDHVRS
jgi:hypothetical protein